MDELGRKLLNILQRDLPICERPFEAVAAGLETTEREVVDRVQSMLDAGILTRFGPLFDADRMGGHITLAAMHVDPWDFERVADLLASFPEVAHNYEREHYLNMWFVVSSDNAAHVAEALRSIEQQSKCKVYDFPKQKEYYLELFLPV